MTTSTSTVIFDNSGSSSGSNASVHESIELRSRNKNSHATAVDPWRQESQWNGRLQLMEHIVKNGETLMQISLLYSVPVSEIKRVNGILADQEIHGLPIIRVPVTRSYLLRRQQLEMESSNNDQPSLDAQLGDEHNSTMAGTSNLDRRTIGVGSSTFSQQGKYSDEVPLLNDQELRSSTDSLNSGGARTRQAIEGILDEADRTVAAVRQNLPSPGLEGGAFHFVDAGAPDNSSNIWLIVVILVIIFVLLPLGLTFLEETGELEEHHQQQHQEDGQ